MFITSGPGTTASAVGGAPRTLVRERDRNLGAVTPVSGGLLTVVNSFRAKDHERAGAGSRSYDGGGRAGHTRGAGVSITGDIFPPKT